MQLHNTLTTHVKSRGELTTQQLYNWLFIERPDIYDTRQYMENALNRDINFRNTKRYLVLLGYIWGKA